ncbi:MAG: ABC transporter substrate-binding protein [Spirochaetales bacterium]|nr:ABC transporter substrate-binding protein [Spirochaetales bacterium]
MRYYVLPIILILFLFAGCGEKTDQLDMLSDENTLVSGTVAMPDSLNFYIDYNTLSIQIASLLYEPLCERDPDTLDIRGVLAKEWKISEDKLTYTFHLNDNARWADGSPVTTDDVLFTYNTIMNPDNLTGLFRMGFEQDFNEVVATDSKTVVFKAKKKRWTAFIEAFTLFVLPKKEFEGKDFNKYFNLMLPPGSGPYIMEDVKTDRYVLLKKRDNYWGKMLPYRQGFYNFQKIKYKFLSDDNIRFEALKKGDIDVTEVNIAATWVEYTESNPPKQIKNNWLIPKKVWNYKPYGFQAFYFNLRRPIFQDIRVRKALALLLNVDLINEKIMFNQYQALRSYFPGYFNNDKDLPLLGFDPDQARMLLAEAGWDRVDTDGVLLNKENKRFEIEFTYSSQSLEKHLTIFKEECEKVGVKVNLALIAPSSIRKKVFTDYDYDMIWISWGGTLFPGIEDLWRSTYADEPNTNNIAGYKNPDVDALLDIYLEEFDIKKRIALMKEIDSILTRDIPTILLWSAPYTRLMYWNKFGMEPKILKKYVDEDSIFSDWWIEKEKLSALKNAVKAGNTLVPEPISIYYDASLEPQK